MDQERYLDVIEEALLAFGSDHAVLSALDVQVVLGWQQAGVPLAIALKGLRQGVHVWERTRKVEDPFPRRLSYFATWVHKLHQRQKARVFATAPAPTPSIPAPDEAPDRPAPDAPSPAWAAVRTELDRLASGAPAALAPTLADLDREVRQGAAEWTTDADRALAFAVDANGRLAEATLATLEPTARDALQRTAEATVRARLPLATPEALAARARLELRRLLAERHDARFFDLRELSR
jgi:hypothetical protein